MYPHERSLVQEMSGRPFKLLGVNNDAKKKTATDAIRKNDLNWRSWWDGGGGPIVKKFKISAFPTIYLIDHRGVIRTTDLRGPRLDEAIKHLVEIAESDLAQSGDSFPFREFADATGKFKVTARLVRREGEVVVLKKESGAEIKVPIGKLSKPDQSYVTTMAVQE